MIKYKIERTSYLKPLFSALPEESIVIENNLTGEERILTAQGMAEYENNPNDFILLEAVGSQAIPSELKTYDEYYTGENLVKLKRSTEQSERGLTVSFSIDELEAMEAGEIPQRALDFLEQHKGELTHD
jgi:hypothetical protein